MLPKPNIIMSSKSKSKSKRSALITLVLFLVNDYATSFKVKIQFDHFRSENNSAKLSLKYLEFSEK